MSVLYIYFIGMGSTFLVSGIIWLFALVGSKMEWFSVVGMLTCWAWPLNALFIIPLLLFFVYKFFVFCVLKFRTYTLEVWQ